VIWHRSPEERRSQVVETGETQVWESALAPDGNVAFVFGNSGNVSRIDLLSHERTPLFEVPPASALTELASSPDGTVLAMAIERELILCDSHTGEIVGRFPPTFGDINSVAFSVDGRMLAVGSDDGEIQVWNRETPAPIRHFSNHEGPVSGIEFTPDGRQLISTGLLDDTLQICDLESAETRGQIATGHTGTQAMAISPDGRLAATGGNDRTIFLWDLGTLAQIARLEGHTGVVSALRFSADGRELLSAGDATIRTWNVESPSSPGEVDTINSSGHAAR
jgi:WD40 repeat protein